jgi:hypothetical protein
MNELILCDCSRVKEGRKLTNGAKGARLSIFAPVGNLVSAASLRELFSEGIFMLQYGLTLPNGGVDPRTTAGFAAVAEAAGWERP